ncbi:RICIN domain-containing protein [Micromonospora fluostatini]
MRSDRSLDDVLRALARHGADGTVPAPVDVRRRGDVRRRRRHLASVALGAVLVGVLGGGTAVIRLSGAPDPVPVGPAVPTTTPTPAPAPTTGPPTRGPTPAAASPPTGTSAPASGGPGPATRTTNGSTSGTPGTAPSVDPGLAGQRQVTIVRAVDQAGALSLLDDGRLGEVDGDEGRRLFVLAPQNAGRHLIRVAEPAADLTDTCWEVRASGSQPLRVVAAACAPEEPAQQFSVVRDGQRNGEPTYAISNRFAYLQFSPTRGLILEELGDAPLTTRFRLVDNGDASRGPR